MALITCNVYGIYTIDMIPEIVCFYCEVIIMASKIRPGRPSKRQLMEKATKQIIADIEDYSQKLNKRVFSEAEINSLLEMYKDDQVLYVTTRLKDFIDFLVDQEILITINIDVPFSSGKMKRYAFKDASEFEIALSIQPGSYLSHYSAMYLHGLIDNIPQIIYTNKEQSRKPRYSSDLSQDNLDRAFARPMRKTKQIAQYDRFKIYLLNGKHTGNLGVIDHNLDRIAIKITGLERTLIDAVVRPDYSGGIEEVLKAFIAAKGEVSVNKMLATLKKMDYIYPYHQAIGFYLEKAGYNENVLKLVEELGIKYNFYLTYQMSDKILNDRWKLYVPRRF